MRRFRPAWLANGHAPARIIGAGDTAALSTPAAAVPRQALWLLAVLTLLWGSNWPLFGLATREVSVWTFRAVAMVVSGAVLLSLARARGLPVALPRRTWPVMVAAALCFLVVWNVASAYAAILIPSGQAAILGFTMPLWLALISWALLGQRPAPRMAVALALGTLAVGLLISRGAQAYAEAPLGFFLGLLAGLGWAVGTLMLKRWPVGVPALVLAGWQSWIAAVPVCLGAWWFAEGPWFMPSWQSVLVIGYIALIPMSIGNAAWFAIVGMLPAQLAALSSILVPVVAMLSGALIHGEPLGPVQWAAMACSALAMWLALGARR